MTGFNPNEFLSNINRNNGLAKPAKFEVIVNLPLIVSQDGLANLSGPFVEFGGKVPESLALQCEAAELPGKNFVTDDVKIYGPTFKIPFQTQYNDISLTFLCSGNFYERFLFDSWMNYIMPTDTNNLRFPKGNGFTGYLTEILIKQYDDIGNEIYNVKLIDAFPINVQAQTLNWSEDGFHRLTVVFSYLRYETERKPIEGGQKYFAESSLDLANSNIPTPIPGKDYDVDADGRNKRVYPEEGAVHPAEVLGAQEIAAAARSGGVAAFNQTTRGVGNTNVDAQGKPVISNYLGGHDAGDNSQNPISGEDYTSDDTFNVEPERAGGYVATDYLGGHDGGDNNQGQKSGQPYAGGGVLSGLVRALALGVVANAIAGARSNRGGDRPPPVGRNYAGSEPTTPPGGKPYGS